MSGISGSGSASAVLGKPLQEVVAKEGVPVPLFVSAAAAHIGEYGADGASGGGSVFDQPPLATPESVIDAFYAGEVRQLPAAMPPADAAAALLHFLYLLPEPVVPVAMYERVVQAGKEDAAQMAELLPQIPAAQRATLECVCSSAARLVAAGHCSAAALSESLAPALCRRAVPTGEDAGVASDADGADLAAALVADAIAWLITNIDELVRMQGAGEALLDD